MSTQLWQPPAIAGAQCRPRVDTGIDAALQKPLVVLMAATGFGKTFAARAVWDRTDGAKAWLPLKANGQPPDADMVRLIDAARCAWGLPPGKPSVASLLADLAPGAGGLLVIDDLNTGQAPALCEALVALVPALPEACHILLLCRDVPALPLALWRSEQRLVTLYQTFLALDFAEWQAAGFYGDEAAWAAALGWWGAASAAATDSVASSTNMPWNKHLEQWVGEVLLPSLSAQNKYLLGVCSLAPEMSFELICAMAGETPSNACNAWEEFPTHSGPFSFDDKVLVVAAHYRPYVRLAWQREDPTGCLQAIQRGSDYLLQHKKFGEAGQLSLESGLRDFQERVLQVAGWTLLFSADRPVLGKLLKQQILAPSTNTKLLQIAWKIEVERLPHSVDSELADLTAQLDGHAYATALALLAAIGWQYDDYHRTELQARAALDAFPDDLHPGYTFATLTLGSVLVVNNDMHLADAVLRGGFAYAARDGLPYLQMEIQQRRALLACESGDVGGARQLAQEILDLSAGLSLQSSAMADSAARMIAWLGLQEFDILAVSTALQFGDRNELELGERGQFPRRWYDGVLAVMDNDLGRAREVVDFIGVDISRRFSPRKWQNEASLLQLWLAARTFDQNRLLGLTQQLRQCNWQANLHRDRRRVLLAAARLLSTVDDDLAELNELHARLLAQGCRTLARQLGLILALSARPFNLPALLAHVRESAEQGQLFDYVWLGSKTTGPLNKLLSAPELATDTSTLLFLKRVLQQLLVHAPHKATADDRPPPSGLTKKEWRVLQLIAQGHTNEQIASGLFVTMATVKTHINHLYAKLNIQSRAQAVDAARSL